MLILIVIQTIMMNMIMMAKENQEVAYYQAESEAIP